MRHQLNNSSLRLENIQTFLSLKMAASFIGP